MKKACVLFFLILSAAVYPQYNFKTADSVLATFNKPDSPGASVLVRKNGEVIYRNSTGYANIAKSELISNKTLFNIASDTKQFTAACIIMLEQKGKLKLDDKLSKYFPEFPEYANKITILDLINHTSGLKDYSSLVWIAGKDKADLSDKDIRHYLAMNDLNSEPGTEHSYSNSGYWFLGQIVGQVAKIPIETFAEKEIFKPLKMKNTSFVRDLTKQKNAAMGYELIDDKYVVCNTDNGVFGSSGILATVDDLLKWLDEMDNKKVLGSAFWNAMLNGNKYANDKGGYYSNGLDFSSYGNTKRIFHGGDLDGFHSVISYFPDEKIDVIVVTNRGDFKIQRMHAALANQFFGYTYKWPAQAPQLLSSSLSKDVIEKYTGLYQAGQMVFEITEKNNTIYALQLWDNVGYKIQPLGENSFTYPDSQADFLFENIVEGKAQSMQIAQSGQKGSFDRIEKYISPEYSKYTGRFRCNSIEAEYTFFIKEGKLFYNINDGKDLPIGIFDGDMISIDKGEVTFHRDENGALKGFTLNHIRVRNLEFVKV